MTGRERVTDIEGVLEALREVVDDSVRTGSRIGYFASLYRQVTVAVAEGIERDEFEDGPRMSRFDAAFGARYLRALDAWREEQRLGRRGTVLGKSWRRAFQAAAEPGPVIAQHLVLGVNAHINLDLAFAAADTCPGRSIHHLEKDYQHVNEILIDVLGTLQDAIGELSPVLRTFDRAFGRLDEEMFGFSIVEARRAAWDAAVQLARDPTKAGRAARERFLDGRAGLLAQLVRTPPLPLAVLLPVVRGSEPSDVSEVVRHLDGALERRQR